MALENNLREARSRMGLNQHDLGVMVDVSRQTISLIERGDACPSVSLALRLAKICQCHVEDLFIYREDPKMIQADQTPGEGKHD